MRREAPERGERGVEVASQLQGVEPAVESVEFGPACGVEDPGRADALIGSLGAIVPAAHPGPVARFGDEATLFRLSAQIEAARPWVARKPVLAG